MLSTVLTMQRRVKRVYRAIKPWVPLLFWAMILLIARPFLIAHVVPHIAAMLPEWVPSWALLGWHPAPAVAASAAAAASVPATTAGVLS